MKRKGLICAILLGVCMLLGQMVYAQEQTNQQDSVYQTEDGVLSIQAPNEQWHVMSDSNHWFVLSDGGNTITVDHLANGEALPAAAVAGGETAAVCQTFVSTKNEVFVITGSAGKQEDLEMIMKMVGTARILKYDTKTAAGQNTDAGTGLSVTPINATYYCISDSLNVRLGCSTDDDAIGSLSYGEPVAVLGAVTQDGNDIGWYQVSFNGTTAYVSARFLSKTKPDGGTDAQAANASASGDYFPVYGKDGSSVAIHPTGGAMYEDEKGRTYVHQGDGVYYCITTDTTYAFQPAIWAYGVLSEQANSSGDSASDSEYYTGEVNVEGDPYGDLVTGSDNYTGEVNVEGDPYGDLVTGSDEYTGEVNVEGDPYGDLVTGSDGYSGEVNVEGDPYGDLVTGSSGQ